LGKELPLEMTYSEVSLPSVMNNNEEKIINGDKPTKVGKSINIEEKLTRQIDMANYGMLTWLVDMTRSVKSRMEVDMMKTHILTTHVDMTRKGITTNKVEDNILLESDYLLHEMMMTLKLEVKLGQLLIIFPHLMKVMEKSLMKIKTNQVMDVCKVNIVKVKDFDEVVLVVQVQVRKFEIKNVLLDRGSSVNVTSKSL
jgi:MarR-like DNA-binding transcriptional regulator SgrR of sgrS sRNA